MSHFGSYDPVLVGLSILVAIVGSFTAFEVVAQARANRGLARVAWLGASAIAAGGAIWSMHFIGMLAFHVGLPVSYDIGITALSLVVPVLMTGVGLALTLSAWSGPVILVPAALFMGLGVVAMHYLGMSGMRMAAHISYDPLLVATSVLIAVGASFAALWLLSKRRSLPLRLTSACLMGLAIAGMHYTGMAAASIHGEVHPSAVNAAALDPALLAVVIASVTGAILLLAFVSANAAQAGSIRDAERRLATIAANLPGMVYRRVLHPDGSISYPYLSEGATTLLGLRREELDSDLAFDDIARRVVLPDDAARWDKEIRRSAKTLSPYRLEIGLRHRDGTLRWVQSSANPYRAADGAIVWDGVTLDVTERKHAEEALEKSEERAGRIVESVKDHAIFTLDAQGTIVDWAPGAKAVFGWTADEIVGKSFELTFTPDDRAAGVPQKELETARREGCANDERWHLHKNGSRFFVNGSSRPLHDAQGNITGFIKIGRDETKRRATEAELARREAHLAAIFEQSAAGLSETDPSGRFVRVNDRFCEITGRPREELLALRMHDITHPDDLRTNVPLFHQSTETGVSFEIEKRYLKPDGSVVWVHNSVTALRDAEGSPTSIVCVTVDISERKRWEEHQRLLVNELNHRVKNSLATVQSIASQTLRNAESTADARLALEARLQAMARAHDVLTRENWESADLWEVVSEAVAPFNNAREDRLHLKGSSVRVPPRMALALSMSIQELSTNAAKYGALSNETGQVTVAWSLDRRSSPSRLTLEWRESGGPHVQAPSRRGFGSRLIERGLAQELDGEATIEFASTGVTCTIIAPLPEPTLWNSEDVSTTELKAISITTGPRPEAAE